MSPSHRRSTGHALPSAAAQEHVPAKGCHPACIQAVPRDISWSPVPSARARSELVLSPLSLASIVTLSGSHVFPGEIVAMSGLGSAPAVAMMVAGRWDPTLAALRDTDWMCAPGWAPAHSDQWCISSRSGRTSSPEEAALSTAQGGLCAKRQRFRVSCGRRERSCATELAQGRTRIKLLQNVTFSEDLADPRVHQTSTAAAGRDTVFVKVVY